MIKFSTFVEDAQGLIDNGMAHKPPKQSQIAHEVVSDVDESVSAIKNKVTEYSSFETKIGPLAALCKIGEAAVDSEERIGKALKMDCGGEHLTLESSMETIFRCMHRAERGGLRGPEAEKLGESLRALVDGGSE